MKISLNYLKQFLDFELPAINDLADVIGRRLGALEDQPVSLSEIYKDIVIVKVVESSPISGTDHLSSCLIDDAGRVKDVARNDKGLITVVCGAPNVANDLMAAWLPPGSIVPATFFKDQLKLEAREIKGQISNGMLASSSELGLSDDHEGILIVDNDAKPGDSFAKAYQLDDYLIDIENKMFTHRPDCFGLLGVAREVSGILNHPFKSPSWYLDLPRPATASSINLKIQNDIPELVPRFSLVAVDNIEIKPSPINIQSYLTRMGIRPINNIVDLTNMVMLETGQPLHAYDLNKLQELTGSDVTLSVRKPKPNEKLKLLNGKEITPTPETIGIALGDRLIGLGGVMGGESTEVDENTTAILLEAATFDMFTIRRTSMELGLFSEAVTRFTKGQSPLQTTRVLSYTLNKLKELEPNAKPASAVVDDVHLPEETLKRDSLHPPISLSSSFINNRLGTELKTEQMAKLLTNVECSVSINGDELTVTPGFWRTDLEIREDVVEEVGRLYGYENIAPAALTRVVTATEKNKELESEAQLRNLLVTAGANELLTYSFISKKLAEAANQSVDKAFEIANSISPELNYYRLSVLSSLLSKVHMNTKAGFDNFAIFEIGTYHQADRFQDDEPVEYPSLALVYSSNKSGRSAAYYKAKDFLAFLISELNIAGVSFVPLNKVQNLADNLVELAKPFDPERSALIQTEDKQWGIVGEFSRSTVAKLKLPTRSAGLEVDTRLFLNSDRDDVYSPLSKYPAVKQDITLKVPDGHSYSDIYDYAAEQLKGLLPKSSVFDLSPLSIFKPKDSKAAKNYSFHLVITDYERTLKDAEVNELLDKLANSLKDKLGASRI